MSVTTASQPPKLKLLFRPFIKTLRHYGLPVTFHEILEFYRGLKKQLVLDLDGLFIFSRLVFVKKPEQLDRFERAFAYYFYGIDLPDVAEGDPALLYTKQFQEWLKEAMNQGKLPRHALWSMSREELMKMFWDRIREQMEAHHGGSKWIGTGGNSPFGHSGASSRGIRVYGGSKNRSALKVIGDRRYIEYNPHNSLRGDNIRQVLASLKRMVPKGPKDSLDIAATIDQTARMGGEIELVFKRREIDRINLVMLIDNGGDSMRPFADLTRLLFSKVGDRFKSCSAFYFHNTIYSRVYRDPRRSEPFAVDKLLQESEHTRLMIVGDATMAPEELMAPHGIIDFYASEPEPSIEVLKRIQQRFPHSVWLNPIPEEAWSQVYGAWTLDKIRDIFPMADISLAGIKKAVEIMQRGHSSGRRPQ